MYPSCYSYVIDKFICVFSLCQYNIISGVSLGLSGSFSDQVLESQVRSLALDPGLEHLFVTDDSNSVSGGTCLPPSSLTLHLVLRCSWFLWRSVPAMGTVEGALPVATRCVGGALWSRSVLVSPSARTAMRPRDMSWIQHSASMPLFLQTSLLSNNQRL